MKEVKIVPQTYLSFLKKFSKFSAIQQNEIFNLAKTCLAMRNSQRERQGKEAPSFLFSKRSGSIFHDKGLQHYRQKM